MSDEVRARIHDCIAAFNRGDLDGMLVDYTPTSRYRIAREHPEARECVGPDEVRAYYRGWREQVDEVITAEEYLDRREAERRFAERSGL